MITCEHCGVKVASPFVLDQHTRKRHPEFAKPVEETRQEDVVEKEDKLVKIVSADGRVLEASIGDKFWIGVEISVPESIESDIRRILENGHFYIK